MERLEIVIERGENSTVIDVHSSLYDFGFVPVWSTRRRYEVSADALGWIARVAVLAALSDGPLHHDPEEGWQEIEARM